MARIIQIENHVETREVRAIALVTTKRCTSVVEVAVASTSELAVKTLLRAVPAFKKATVYDMRK